MRYLCATVKVIDGVEIRIGMANRVRSGKVSGKCNGFACR